MMLAKTVNLTMQCYVKIAFLSPIPMGQVPLSQHLVELPIPKSLQNERLVLLEDHEAHPSQPPPDRFLPEEDSSSRHIPSIRSIPFSIFR